MRNMFLSRLLSLSMLLCISTGTLTAQNAKPDRDGAYKFKVWEDTEGCYANTTSDNTADWIQVNDWISKVCIDIGLTGSKKQHKVVMTLNFSSTQQSRLAEVNNRITAESTMPVEVALSNGERLLFADASMHDYRKEQFRNSLTVSAIGMHLDLAKATSNMCDLTKMTDEQRNGYVCEILQDYDMLGVTISDYSVYFTIKTAPTLRKMAETMAKKTKKKNDYKCTTDPPGIDFRKFPDTNTDNPDDILLVPAGYPKQQYNSLTTTNYLRYLYSNCLNWYYKVQLQQYQQARYVSNDEIRISNKNGLNYSFFSTPINTMLVCFRDEKPTKWSYWLFEDLDQDDAEEFVVLLGDAIAEEAGTKAKTVVHGRNERAERRIDYKGMDVRVELAGSNDFKWCVMITVYPPKGTSAPSVTKPVTTPVSTQPAATKLKTPAGATDTDINERTLSDLLNYSFGCLEKTTTAQEAETFMRTRFGHGELKVKYYNLNKTITDYEMQLTKSAGYTYSYKKHAIDRYTVQFKKQDNTNKFLPDNETIDFFFNTSAEATQFLNTLVADLKSKGIRMERFYAFPGPSYGCMTASGFSSIVARMQSSKDDDYDEWKQYGKYKVFLYLLRK